MHESYESWILGIGKFCLIGDQIFLKIFIYIAWKSKVLTFYSSTIFPIFFIYYTGNYFLLYWNIFPKSKKFKISLFNKNNFM